MKLSKAEIKICDEVFKRIEKEKLTFEDKEYIYENFNAGFLGDVTTNSAYFTPLDMAYDFGLFCYRSGVMVDMCAGIGTLTFAARTRDTYENKIKKSICIERNQDYIEVGKKLLPDAEWICGDMFDKTIWDYIINKYGRIDSVISNPPFGKVSKTDCDRSWLSYKGSEIDMAAIEIALKHTNNVSMILPAMSVTFKWVPYYLEYENRKVEKLKKDIGMDIYMSNPGIDTTVYSGFKNTNIRVEYVDIYPNKYF